MALVRLCDIVSTDGLALPGMAQHLCAPVVVDVSDWDPHSVNTDSHIVVVHDTSYSIVIVIVRVGEQTTN